MVHQDSQQMNNGASSLLLRLDTKFLMKNSWKAQKNMLTELNLELDGDKQETIKLETILAAIHSA
mgnify:CR=1 FL=1